MERSDDVLVEALGAEAAERVRQIEKVLSHRLAGLGRVVPVSEPPELPPPLVEEAEQEAVEEPTKPQPPVWRIPPDTSRTAREISAEKRRLFPDFVMDSPGPNSLLVRKY